MTKQATKTAPRAKRANKATGAGAVFPPKRASRGPKPGSARSNQSAVLTNADRIKTVVGTRSGNGIFVEAEGGKSLVISDWQNSAQTLKLAKVGQSLAALQSHLDTIAKPGAKLARGVDTHNSPHSAKAVRDNRTAEGKAKGSAGRKARGDAAAVAGKATKK